MSWQQDSRCRPVVAVAASNGAANELHVDWSFLHNPKYSQLAGKQQTHGPNPSTHIVSPNSITNSSRYISPFPVSLHKSHHDPIRHVKQQLVDNERQSRLCFFCAGEGRGAVSKKRRGWKNTYNCQQTWSSEQRQVARIAIALHRDNVGRLSNANGRRQPLHFAREANVGATSSASSAVEKPVEPQRIEPRRDFRTWPGSSNGKRA